MRFGMFITLLLSVTFVMRGGCPLQDTWRIDFMVLGWKKLTFSTLNRTKIGPPGTSHWEVQTARSQSSIAGCSSGGRILNLA